MKRTSQLELGPVLREENTHTTQRETLQEEGSRQLARAVLQMNMETPEMQEAVEHMSQQLANDIDERVVNSFVSEVPGVNYLAPVDDMRSLPPDVPTGTMCYVHASNELYIYIGRRWITMTITRNENGTIERVEATTANEQQD